MELYKCGVIKSPKNGIYLFVLVGNEISDGFPLTDSNNIYADMKLSQVNIGMVEFQDGTENVAFEYAVNNGFKDIFVKIDDYGLITIFDDMEQEENILDVIKKGDFTDMLQELFDDNEIYEG